MAELLVNGAAEDDFENVHGAVDGSGEVDGWPTARRRSRGCRCKVLRVQAGPGRHNPAKALVSHGW